MPQSVEIPGQGIAEFPDEMTPEEIGGVIQSKFYPDQTPAPTPRKESISAPPTGTATGEAAIGTLPSAAALKAGKLEGQRGETVGSAANRLLEPTQPTSALQVHGAGDRSLLGTTEQIPPSPSDSPLVAAGKAIINVGNRTMAGLTTPEMLPLLPIAGSEATLGKLTALLFGGQAAAQIPEQIGGVFTAPTTQGKIESGLGAGVSGLIAAGGLGYGSKIGEAKPTLTDTLFPKAEPPTVLAPEAPFPTQPERTIQSATQERPITESSVEQYPPAAEGRPTAETSRSDSTQQGGEIPQEPIVVPEQPPTAPETPVAETTATTTAEPAAPAETTGIAQRVHEERAPGAIQPGEGVSAEEMVQRGRELLKTGSDPEAILTGVEQGKAVTGDEIAVLRAKHEEMGRATNQAADALRQNPNDPALKQTYEDSFKAETDFAKRIKPAQTEWHKVGQAMQGEVAIDTGTFTGLRRAFVERTGRDVTPKESVKLEKTADNVKRVTDDLEKAKAAYRDLVGKETKGRAPVTLEDLRTRFAERIRSKTPC